MSASLRSALSDFAAKYDVPAVVGGTLSCDDPLNFDVVGTVYRGSEQKVDKSDKWHIGSCAKSITAALYARLVEQGATNWDCSVASLFPDLASEISDQWNDRTVEELFLCRAGMEANPDKPALIRGYNDTRPLVDQRTDTAVTAMRNAPKPRDKFVYSNLGYVVIGAAIDRITGMPFEEALEQFLLKPLGITSLGYGPPDVIWGHKGKLHLGLGSLVLFAGKPANPQDLYSDNPRVLSSAGTLHLTILDWAKFLKIFLKGNAEVLESETIDYLFANPDESVGPMVKGWARATGIENVSYGIQGSNTMWAATALLNEDRSRLSFVVCNDGRTRLLTQSAKFAARLLDEAS